MEGFADENPTMVEIKTFVVSSVAHARRSAGDGDAGLQGFDDNIRTGELTSGQNVSYSQIAETLNAHLWPAACALPGGRFSKGLLSLLKAVVDVGRRRGKTIQLGPVRRDMEIAVQRSIANHVFEFSRQLVDAHAVLDADDGSPVSSSVLLSPARTRSGRAYAPSSSRVSGVGSGTGARTSASVATAGVPISASVPGSTRAVADRSSHLSAAGVVPLGACSCYGQPFCCRRWSA